MNVRTIAGHLVTAVLGVATVAVLWFLSTAEGDEHVGKRQKPRKAVKQEMPEAPDVIIITIDTLRADRLGVYGYERARTPNLDAWGRDGIVFTEATVPLPRTTPGLASLMTGLTPENHGSREVWARIKKGTLIAEVMSDLEYQTFGITSNSAAGKKQKLHKGFDKFIDAKDIKGKHKRSDADKVSKMAIEWLEKADADQPIFMWVHYVDPHWRYGPPKKRWSKQPAAAKCKNLIALEKGKTLTTGELTVNLDGKAEFALEDCSKLYDSEISFTDSEIGLIINKLQEQGRWENAIKVFTADHGENLGEDGYYYNHGPSLADASLKVPLILSGPTIPKGKVDDTITRIEDVAPTLYTLLDLAEEDWPKVDGIDMAWRWDPDLEAPEKQVKVAVAESGGALHLRAFSFLVSGRKSKTWCINDAPYSYCSVDKGELQFFNHVEDRALETPLTDLPEEVAKRLRNAAQTWGPEGTRSQAVRTPEFKLVAYPDISGDFRHALYDLKKDPRETTDVKEQHPREYAALLELLERWQADLPIYEARERTAQEESELRSLGYIGN